MRPGAAGNETLGLSGLEFGAVRNYNGIVYSSAKPGERKAEAAAFQPADFQKILLLLRSYSGVDFSAYKTGTLQRRTLQRMVLKNFKTLADYAALLEGNPEELEGLYADVLIKVTGFFRNPEACAALQRILSAKLAQRPRDLPIRVWVPGCSAGQEAYSLAMVLTELLDPNSPPLQVFATDLNETTLVKARAALYGKNLVRDIPPERLKRFFVAENGAFRIRNFLRDKCVFARQNLLSDPPFSRLDLISCRNLLIYVEPAWQMKILLSSIMPLNRRASSSWARPS